MKRILLGLIYLLVSLVSMSQNIVWNGYDDVLYIGERLDILEDENCNLTIEEVSSKAFEEKFVKSEQSILNFGYTECIYWLRFSLQNTTKENLLLEIAHAFLPVTDLFFMNDSGKIEKMEAGYQIPMNDKIVKHHFQVFPLPEGKRDFYVRVLSNSHPLPVRIWKRTTYEIKSYRQRLVYGFYIGFMCFVIISSIFFFFSLRNWLYLFYAFVVFIYICYASMVMDGFILYFFPKVNMMFWYINIPTIGVAVQTAYCLIFLEVKKYVPKLNRIIWGVIIYFALYAFLKLLMPLTVILALNTVHALISFFVMGFVGIRVGKKGNKIGYYFALAYSIYFLLVLIEAVYIQTGFPPYLIGLSHVAIATIIEAFILSFLLTKRFEWEKEDVEKERLEAQQKLLKTTKENEKIVKEQNVMLEQEVEKRTVKLKKVNEKLEIVAATKDKFFSIIAHDLKSPFNIMLGFSGLLYENFHELAESKQWKYIEIINKELVNTYNLLDNLLLWAHSQKGSIVYKPENLNLSVVVYEVIAFFEQQAKNKSTTIKNRVPENIFVKADKNMLLTILRNLIINAIKFTPKGGEVIIETNSTNDNKINFNKITVKDNGVGISPETQSKLFDVTKSVSTKGTQNETGTGLGLILCKEFIERHGGEIFMESELGKGSEFYFTIPV